MGKREENCWNGGAIILATVPDHRCSRHLFVLPFQIGGTSEYRIGVAGLFYRSTRQRHVPRLNSAAGDGQIVRRGVCPIMASEFEGVEMKRQHLADV